MAPPMPPIAGHIVSETLLSPTLPQRKKGGVALATPPQPVSRLFTISAKLRAA